MGAESFTGDERTAPAQRDEVRGPRFVSALPLVAAGAAYLLLLAVALRDWIVPLSGVALGAIEVSVFLVARLVISQRQHAADHGSLHDRRRAWLDRRYGAQRLRGRH